jgi:hypothetical protein
LKGDPTVFIERPKAEGNYKSLCALRGWKNEPQSSFFEKTKTANHFLNMDTSLVFDPSLLKISVWTKRRRRAQRQFLKKTWVVLIFWEGGEKEPLFLLHPGP